MQAESHTEMGRLVDSGLSHVASAVGTPTVMTLGPTPHLTLGHSPPNVKVLRSGFDCEPCWYVSRVTVESIVAEVKRILGRLGGFPGATHV